MSIDRTAYNALANDSGSNLDGSLWDKSAIKDVLLDPIDVAIAAAGSPNDLAYDLLPDADGTRKLGSAAKSWDGSEVINLDPAKMATGTLPATVRTNPRLTTVTGDTTGTPSYNTDTCDVLFLSGQAAAISSMATNKSGTPVRGQHLLVQIVDNATPRAITWGAGFAARGQALPTTTVASKLLTVGFIFDTVWGCVGAAQEA